MTHFIIKFLLVSIVHFQGDCKAINVVPFTGTNNVTDRFKLSELVSTRFKKLGFEISNNPAAKNCRFYQCIILHSENYWQLKRDTVILIIVDEKSNEIVRYYGVTEEIELTFRSGYRKATKLALEQMDPNIFH